jgi:hypothetical protein
MMISKKYDTWHVMKQDEWMRTMMKCKNIQSMRTTTRVSKITFTYCKEMSSFIRLDTIIKTYENNEIEPVRVLRGINLDIQQ